MNFSISTPRLGKLTVFLAQPSERIKSIILFIWRYGANRVHEFLKISKSA